LRLGLSRRDAGRASTRFDTEKGIDQAAELLLSDL
jgi:hypothetical protein